MEYYVDQSHPSANDQNPGTVAQPWKTITKANTSLIAGDTVFIKSGTYTSYIAPNNSGTSSKRITYTNYGTDTVTVQNASYGILLDGKSYITVKGINFYNLDAFMYLQNGANYNIIAYCNFDQMRTYNWGGAKIYFSSSYNWIHHCSFSRWGRCNGTSTQGATLDIGNEESQTDFSEYNLLEDNTLYRGGHHILGVWGRFNTIRNNYFYSDGWMSGNRGGRNLFLNGYSANSGRNLIEGNRLGYAEQDCGAPGATEAAQISNSYNILRYNAFYYNDIAGLHFSETSSYINNANYNQVYNNTFFANNQNTDPYWNPDAANTAISFTIYSGSWVIRYNNIKNNLLYRHDQYNGKIYGFMPSNLETYQTFSNNYNGDALGDPKFIDASPAPGDPTNRSYPNLNLQSSSLAINYGTYLTQTKGGGSNSTTLVVDDAGYFQNGTWAPPGATQADWIVIGDVSNVVQISSINYSNNTITLSSPATWTDNANIWLYKKSDGMQVLFGSAPDAGAYEFSQGEAPSPPTNLRIISP